MEKAANENWLEKEVRNPETGNTVKVKSLSPEQRKKYEPRKDTHQEIEDKKRELKKPKTREERQFQFLVPQIMKMHNDDSKEFSHTVKKKMKDVGLSHSKDKKWLEPLLKHFTNSDWKTNRSDFAYASNDRVKKIANEIINANTIINKLKKLATEYLKEFKKAGFEIKQVGIDIATNPKYKNVSVNAEFEFDYNKESWWNNNKAFTIQRKFENKYGKTFGYNIKFGVSAKSTRSQAYVK